MAGASAQRGSFGFWGVMVISVNTMNGPGLLAIPKTFFDAGYLIPCCLLIFIAALAAASGCFLVDAIVATTEDIARKKEPKFTEADSIVYSPRSAPTTGQR